MTRLTRPYTPVFRVDIIQFVQDHVHLISPGHDVAARPDPLTEEMLMLNNIPKQSGTGRMLQRQHKRMRSRSKKLLDKTPLNPRLQTITTEIEETSQQLCQCLPIGLVLGDIPVQPHHMRCITPPRLSNKMTSKIIEIIVLLKTHATTRTPRQSIPTSTMGSPLATVHEVSDIQHLHH